MHLKPHADPKVTLLEMSLPHLNVDKDAVVGFIEHFVAFGIQRELKRDLGLACWNFSCLGHLDVTADQLDGLQTALDQSIQAETKRGLVPDRPSNSCSRSAFTLTEL